MKILVLFPLDEKYSYIATALYKALDADTKDNTFVMPMFTEWQMLTKNMIIGNDLPVHWNVATFGSIIKAREMYKIQQESNKDFLLIGNIAPQYEFDAIFNFQDVDQDLPYEDMYVDKLKTSFADIPVLNDNLKFYDASASQMTLHNIAAAAEFLSSYMKTDPHLEEIKQKYIDTLHFKENDNA